MISAAQKDEAFLADVEAARKNRASLHLWWLGQSGFLLQWQGHHLLLDPYLSDSLTAKYANSDKPHVRMTERVVAPERLDFIEVVTSSHNHTDHLDRETLVPLASVNPQLELVIPEANRDFVAERLRPMLPVHSLSPGERAGVKGNSMSEPPRAPQNPVLRGLDIGQSYSVGPWNITAVPAAHNLIEKDGNCRSKYLGFVIEAGPWTVYHSGDTKQFAGMEELLQAWRIDAALLPINGDRPERRVAGNLNGIGAAHLAKSIGARLVIPCHFEMFEFNTASPEEFVRECEKLGQSYRILRAGERWSSNPL